MTITFFHTLIYAIKRAFLEKRGMVFWRESNKEELKKIYIY